MNVPRLHPSDQPTARAFSEQLRRMAKSAHGQKLRLLFREWADQLDAVLAEIAQ